MFRIHFLDVGQGDCIILQFENGRIYLIDSNEIAEKITPIEYLTSVLRVAQIETIVVTHPHDDHISGLNQIIEQIPVRQVWLTDYPYKSYAYRRFLSVLAHNPEIRVIFPRSGTSVSEGKDLVQILAPPPNLLHGTHSDVNNASLVLKVTIAHLEQRASTSALLGSERIHL